MENTIHNSIDCISYGACLHFLPIILCNSAQSETALVENTANDSISGSLASPDDPPSPELPP